MREGSIPSQPLKFKMEYATPGKRKTKTDKRAKARYNRYKKGGSMRVRKKKKID